MASPCEQFGGKTFSMYIPRPVLSKTAVFQCLPVEQLQLRLLGTTSGA